MQLRLTVDLDLDLRPPLGVRTRTDGSTSVRLAPGTVAVADATLVAEAAEVDNLAQTIVNAGGLREARYVLTLARRLHGPTPA